MRVEDLPKIQQNQITNNALMYVSLNGIPLSAGIVDIASQVSGVTGSYVINSQLSGVSGVLNTQINNLSGYLNNNAVFVTGNQLIIGNKSISGLTKILYSPTTSGTNGLLLSYEDASNTGNNFYAVLKAYHPDVTRIGLFASNVSGAILPAGFLFTSDNNISIQGYQNNGSINIDNGGNINCFGNIIASNNLNVNTINDNLGNSISIDLTNGFLKSGPNTFLSWPDKLLYDSSTLTSVDWENRNLIDTTSTNVLDWRLLNLSANWKINNIGIANVNNLQTTGQVLYKYLTGISGNTTVNNVVFATGNQTISGNKTFAASIFSSLDSQASIDINGRSLIKNNAVSVNWNTKVLNDSIENTSIDWNNRFLSDFNVLTALDWNNRLLYNTANQVVADWSNTNLSGINGTTFDWSNGIFYGVDNNGGTIDMVNYQLFDNTQTNSVNWNTRNLLGSWTIGTTMTPFTVMDNIDSIKRMEILSDNTFYIYDLNAVPVFEGLSRILIDSANQTSVSWDKRTLSGNWGAQSLTMSGVSMSIENVRIFKTQKINFKTTGSYSIFTVGNNFIFNIDTMEVITSDISSPSAAPFIQFGNTSNSSAYQINTQTTSNSSFSRHIFDNPQNGIDATNTLTATISTASTAVIHSGYLIFKGYFLKK